LVFAAASFLASLPALIPMDCETDSDVISSLSSTVSSSVMSDDRMFSASSGKSVSASAVSAVSSCLPVT